MSFGLALALMFVVGFVGGLRSMTAPAVVAWGAHLGWIQLAGSHLVFMESTISVIVFTVLALGEFVADKLPSVPARTSPGPLVVRILVGLLTGACLGFAVGSMWLGAVIGAVGAIVGAFVGYQARMGLTKALQVPGVVIALAEDLLAAGLGLFAVSRF